MSLKNGDTYEENGVTYKVVDIKEETKEDGVTITVITGNPI